MFLKMKKIMRYMILVTAIFIGTSNAPVLATVSGYGPLTNNALKTYSDSLQLYEPPLKAYLGGIEELVMVSSTLDASAEIIDDNGMVIMTIIPTNSHASSGTGDLSIEITMDATSGTQGFGPFISTSTLTLTPYIEDGSRVAVTGATGTGVTADSYQVIASWGCYAEGVTAQFEYLPNASGLIEAINGIFGQAGGFWEGCVNS